MYARGSNSHKQISTELSREAFCPEFIPLNAPFSSSDIRLMAAGSCHSIIVTHNGEVFGRGKGSHGTLSTGDGLLLEQYTLLPNMPTNIKFIACTYRNTFIVTEENSIYSCGFNANSECGGGVPLANVRRVLTLTQVTVPNLTTTDTITNIVCGGCHTFIVINNKRLFSVGKNTRGQLGTGNQSKKLVFTEVFLPEDDTSNIKQISCGYNTSFVLTESNRLYSCGNNEWKSLCLKSDARWITKFTECDDELLEGEIIDSVVSGYFHTVLVNKDKRMFIAGANEHGELAIANRFAERLQKLQRLPFDEFHHDLRVYSRGMYTILVADENRMYYAGSFAQKKKTRGFEQWTMEYKESELRKISTFLCYDNAAVCILGDWKNEIQNMFKQLSKLVGNSALSDVMIA